MKAFTYKLRGLYTHIPYNIKPGIMHLLAKCLKLEQEQLSTNYALRLRSNTSEYPDTFKVELDIYLYVCPCYKILRRQIVSLSST